jgi:CotH kinase protein/Lamin Tail Domain
MRLLRRFTAAVLLFSALPASSLYGQDFYDPATLRTVDISFHDADWLPRLRQNFNTGTNILADLSVDGVTYSDVGVRIRGFSSYFGLPPGSEKFSLKVDVDFTDPAQEVMGYDSLNFNNSFLDPTFSREVVYSNYAAQFIPNPRANNIILTLNGQNWGVYVNVQQPDKRMLRDWFDNADGLRASCANNPHGPGLAYAGPHAAAYAAYEINHDGGLADPWSGLIALTDVLSNTPLADWQRIDTHFAIDPSIWSVALESLFADGDSYVYKGCDFVTYRNPVDGRTHLLQRDANETFVHSWFPPTMNFDAPDKPVLSRMLAVPELRQRYLAHYRVMRRDLNWDYFGPRFQARRALLDAAVKADPKRLYSYANFQDNFTDDVMLNGEVSAQVVGLRNFVSQRAMVLTAMTELISPGPQIITAQASSTTPAPGTAVTISATISALREPVSKVELFYRPDATGVYRRTPMQDDGNSGDGAADDDVYAVTLPVAGTAGQRVAWYVAVTAGNLYGSLSFFPERTELQPNIVQYTTAGTRSGLRITEWMYDGAGDEFVELTNLSAQPLDLTGWSLDDVHAIAGAFSLSAFGTVQPGESVLVTESTAADFRTAWDLAPMVKIIGELGAGSGNNYGRADEIHVFNADGVLEDRLNYGDQTYPGSIRTQNASGQVPCPAIAQNAVLSWQLSTIGDSYGSHAATHGDVGTPGSFTLVNCTDALFASAFETAP